jgi:hypothetical protein
MGIRILTDHTQIHVGGRKQPKKGWCVRLSDLSPNIAGFGPIPDQTTYSQNPACQAVLNDILGNDKYGCCTEADQYHRQAIRQAAAGQSVYRCVTEDVLDTYGRDTGFVATDPNTDNGASEDTVLTNHVTLGITSGTGLINKATGYLVIPSDRDMVRACSSVFVGAAICCCLPESWIQNANPGSTWDMPTDPFVPDNGHCFTLGDQGLDRLNIWTWGRPLFLTYDALAASAQSGGNVYVELDADVIVQGITAAPDGLDWPKLVALFQALGGAPPASVSTMTLIEKLEREGMSLVEWIERQIGRKL